MTRSQFVAWGAAAIVAAAGIALALQPPAWQVSHFLPDDAYYYLQIARNIAEGQGSTLDGINLTNGFHPLWMALLVGIYRVLPGFAAVPAALIISALCGAATVWLLGRLLTRWGVPAGWIAVCLGLVVLNPWMALQWVNGLETAVACLLLVATWLYADRALRDGSPGLRQATILAALASLAALGRTDFAVALAPLLIYVWFKLWRGSARPAAAALGYAVLMAGVVLAIQMPWLAWNWHTFGTLEQSSGASFSFVNHQLLYNVHANDLLTNFKGTLLGLWNSGRIALSGFVAPLTYAVTLVLAALWRRRQRLSFKLPDGGVAIWAAAGLVLLFAVHGAIRWAYRPWYAAPLVIAVVLAVGYCSRQLPRPPLPRWLMGTLLALGIVSFAVGTPRVLAEYGEQSRMFEVATWVNENVAPGQAVGAFNSGIYAYFSDRTIVNLDGLVNNGAAAALRSRSLYDYALLAGVRYVIDFDISVGYRYAWAWGGPKPLAELPVEHVFTGNERSGSIRVYRLQ